MSYSACQSEQTGRGAAGTGRLLSQEKHFESGKLLPTQSGTFQPPDTELRPHRPVHAGRAKRAANRRRSGREGPSVRITCATFSFFFFFFKWKPFKQVKRSAQQRAAHTKEPLTLLAAQMFFQSAVTTSRRDLVPSGVLLDELRGAHVSKTLHGLSCGVVMFFLVIKIKKNLTLNTRGGRMESHDLTPV